MGKPKNVKPSSPQPKDEDKGEGSGEINLIAETKVEVIQEDGNFQTVGNTEKPDRRLHTWYRRRDGSYKCVICGGISTRPSYNGLPEKVERLTEEERNLAPPLHGRQKRYDDRCDDEDNR